jgi:hypothetical protein
MANADRPGDRLPNRLIQFNTPADDYGTKAYWDRVAMNGGGMSGPANDWPPQDTKPTQIRTSARSRWRRIVGVLAILFLVLAAFRPMVGLIGATLLGIIYWLLSNER